MPPKIAKISASNQEALDKLGLECKVLELLGGTRMALLTSIIGCNKANSKS